jgi:hypothetical protein
MLACESAQAAEPQWVTISGAGSISCGDAVQTLSAHATNEQSKTDAFQIQNWVKGYITAYNMRGIFDDPAHVRTTSGVEPRMKKRYTSLSTPIATSTRRPAFKMPPRPCFGLSVPRSTSRRDTNSDAPARRQTLRGPLTFQGVR